MESGGRWWPPWGGGRSVYASVAKIQQVWLQITTLKS